MLAANCRQRPQTGADRGGRHRQPQQQQQPLAEIRVREQNLQQQQRLARVAAKFDRDLGAWGREDEKRKRGVLVDLAKMLDARLTPSIDDWFAKRRIRQPSRLLELRAGDAAATGAAAAAPGEVEETLDDEERRLRRLRLLEMKRKDWCGVTSVAIFSAKFHHHQQQPQHHHAGDSDSRGHDQLLEAATDVRRHVHPCRSHHHHRPRTAGPVLVTRTK